MRSKMYKGNSLIKKENLEISFSSEKPDEYDFDSKANGAVSNKSVIFFSITRYEGSPVSADGFAFLVCHELGHFLGGKPTYQNPDPKAGLSVEGQADYFAAKECMPKFLKHKAGLKLGATLEIQDEQAEAGKEHCSHQANQKACEKTLSIGYRFLQLLSGKSL